MEASIRVLNGLLDQEAEKESANLVLVLRICVFTLCWIGIPIPQLPSAGTYSTCVPFKAQACCLYLSVFPVYACM